MSKILGLDLGTNSIGWALVDPEKSNILDMGVRVFEQAVNDLNTGKEESKNAQRRMARQTRRQLDRKKKRKELLFKNLLTLGFINNHDKHDFFRIDPYQSRRDALYGKLEIEKIGRAFYHICKRRGFKSSRKDKIDEKEKGAIYDGDKSGEKPGISELKRELTELGFKTIGEYFCSLDPHEKRIRNRYTERKMYEEEFDLIWNTQKQFYPDILTDEHYHALKNEIIFYQRPLKSQKDTIGKCMLEPKKKRIAKSHPLFQEFRMLQQVNNLMIKGGDRWTEEEQELTENERSILVDHLSKNDKVEFKPRSIYTILGLNKKIEYDFNLKSLKQLDGMKTLCAFRKALGDDYDKTDYSTILRIWELLNFATDNDWLIQKLIKDFDTTQETALACSKIKLEPDYGSLSFKAINKIIPYLRNGDIYSDAVIKAGYNINLIKANIEILDELPEPPNLRNPIVNCALQQLRKTVNSIIDVYGKPDIIRLEMGRDLKTPKFKRLEMHKDNQSREIRNNTIRQKLMDEELVDEPKKTDIVKYLLWEECNQTCPYTGRSISLNQMYKTGEVDIEHILPYSRSLDDSFMNKTLCFRKENERKGNNTPWEAYSADESLYDDILDRIKKFPHSKYKKFTIQSLENYFEEEGGFISRQLNDTRYISREALQYLKHLSPNVTVATGSTTAFLRHYWGLVSLLREKDENGVAEEKKNRDDHRHHSLDALVIALTDRGSLQRLSTYYGKYGYLAQGIEKRFPMPWDDFRNQAMTKIKCLIISHKIKTKARGALHAESNYGLLHDYDGNPKTNHEQKKIFVIRKNISSFEDQNPVQSIVDNNIRTIVEERLISKGVYIKQKKYKIPKDTFKEPLYLAGKDGSKIPIKKVRIKSPSGSMVNIRNYNIWVEPASNHHIEIFSDPNGKLSGRMVTLLEAVGRKKLGKPVIDKYFSPNHEFYCSLMRNELVIWGDLPVGFDYYDKDTYHLVFEKIFRVQKMDVRLNIIFRKHFVTFTSDTDSRGIKRASVTTLNCRKIKILPNGYIEPVND